MVSLNLDDPEMRTKADFVSLALPLSWQVSFETTLSFVGLTGIVDWHMSSGLAAVFIEAPDKFQQLNNPIPQAVYDQCKHWNKATSGNIVGKNSTSDFAGQPWGPFPLVMVCAVSMLVIMKIPDADNTLGMDT